MDNNIISPAAAAAIYQRKCAQALEHLQGIVDGMMSDGRLDPREVQFLNDWLSSHPEATADWPGSLLHRRVRQILADGLISSAELRYLHEALSHLGSTVFEEPGSAAPAVVPLPVEDSVAVDARNARICLAGAFLFGTRAACERLIVSAGATPCDRVSTKVHYLVIGTRASPAWTAEPYGEDIEEAVALRGLGHRIAIISERRLLESLC
jgi:hypothetical protein